MIWIAANNSILELRKLCYIRRERMLAANVGDRFLGHPARSCPADGVL